MRSKKATLQVVQPDLKYGSAKIARLINYVMRDGKKSVATRQVYAALQLLADKTGKDPVEVFDSVLNSIAPQMEVRSRRVGGAAYQVPMPVRPRRATALALRWLVVEANKRSNKEFHTFAEKLLAEMTDALGGAGGAILKRDTSHRMAEANKAFSHFRW
jgi:small subunit ribosomal protein S7